MNKLVLQTMVQEFIKTYELDISMLAFAGSPFDEIPVQELIEQIIGYRISKNKLPTWYNNTQIFYPPKINIEQTSSEITANYKASILKGKTLADVTGGFGVDTRAFSRVFETVDHFEQQEWLSQIAKHNLKSLEVLNVTCHIGDGLKMIEDGQYDAIYIDPSRRHENKGKVFFLKDCEPDITSNLSYLFDRAPQIVLKTSPMLDISVGLSELSNVSEIHVVAVDNEVKELLWLLKKEYTGATKVKTINLKKRDTEKFNFVLGEDAPTSYGLPKKYVYEPNAAILKSGAFHLLSDAYRCDKLQKHSHLYTSDDLIEFPGRRFIVINSLPYSKPELTNTVKGMKVNVTTRNFPLGVAELRKKWNIKDGGSQYLFFTTIESGKKVVLICEKV